MSPIDEVIASAQPERGIGDNSGAMDPFTAHERDVNDAYDEAKLWIDGTKVESQEQADALGKLYTMLEDAQKAAEAQRVALKKPHDDAAAAVQKQWKPLVDKAEKARKAVKTAVQRWNDHLADLQRIEAERVRREAQEAAAKARAEHEAAVRANNLAALEEAEQQVANAATLADMAKAAERAKAVTGTGGARGIGASPKPWIGTVTDATVLLRHLWSVPEHRTAIEALARDIVNKEVRAGRREIPGCVIKQEERVL